MVLGCQVWRQPSTGVEDEALEKVPPGAMVP